MLYEPFPKRTFAELNDALAGLVHAAYGDTDSRNRSFSVPVNLTTDADVILADGIAELMLLRDQVTRQAELLARSELRIARLKRLVVHYRLLLRMGHGPEQTS